MPANPNDVFLFPGASSPTDVILRDNSALPATIVSRLRLLMGMGL